MCVFAVPQYQVNNPKTDIWFCCCLLMLSVVSCFKHFVNINISFSNRSYEFVKPLDTNYMYIRDEYDKCPESLTNGAQCEKLLQGRSSIFMDIYLGRLEVIPFLRLSELNALKVGQELSKQAR